MADPINPEDEAPEAGGLPMDSIEAETAELEGGLADLSPEVGGDEEMAAMPALDGLAEDGDEAGGLAMGMDLDVAGLEAEGVEGMAMGDMAMGAMDLGGDGLADGEGAGLDFGAAAPAVEQGPIAGPDIVMGIPVSLKIVLGSVQMPIANLLKLSRGAIIPLDRKVGDPVDVVVNDRIVARGEVVVVDAATSRFGVSLTEVVVNGPGQEKVQ